LRGNALVEAESWAKDKSLGYQDKDFLAASRKQEREEELAAAELQQEKKARKRMLVGFIVLFITLGVSVTVASIAGREAINAQAESRKAQKLAKNAQAESQKATQELSQTKGELAKQKKESEKVQQEVKDAQKLAEKAKTDLENVQDDKNRLEAQKNQLTDAAKTLQIELKSKSEEINEAEQKIENFKSKQQQIQAQVKLKEQELETANKNTTELKNSIAKVTELSAVASQLQQKGKTNEANQSLNIAGLVLQDKIENPQLKEALLNSALVLGYQYQADEKYEANKTDELKKAEEQLITSLKYLSQIENDYLSQIENDIDNNNSIINLAASLVYIYYAKGRSNKSVADYKKAFDYIKSLKSQFKSNVDLFTLDLNILYNGNADIVALLYRQLKELDESNTIYAQSLKEHLLNELDYLMQQHRWREADEKNWQFILYLAGREKEGFLQLTNVRNFNCEDLKELDTLWTKNSGKHFGYSVQKEIYLASGNSLDFDWEKGEFVNWNEKGYNDFANRVGWQVKGQWRRYEELPMNLKREDEKKSLRGELPERGRGRGELPLRLGLVRFVVLSSCRDL
jgi:hypothetical protein